MGKGKILSINCSKVKGTAKNPVTSALLIEGVGLDGDAHAAGGLRQVSLLSIESIRKQEAGAGDFAENITTAGMELSNLKIGDRLRLGNALIEISQIGKECHRRCAIYYKAGNCIMPREGIFAKVINGARIAPGDDIEVMGNV
ncbi:MAG: MOSC domain-containing protein [Candidatus Omnitrophota bacterium]